MKPKYKVTVQPTSMSGTSLLVLRKDGDPEYLSTMCQTVPTEVAEWVQSLARLEETVLSHVKLVS